MAIQSALSAISLTVFPFLIAYGNAQSRGSMLPRRIASVLFAQMRAMPWYPGNWIPSLRAARILWRDYGHVASVRSGIAIDHEGRPLPWYTYPAIEYLEQLDFRTKSVFEYGAGMSTLYWASVALRVVSVEDDERWFTKISNQLPANASVSLETDLAKFPLAIVKTGMEFDVIVVDGPARGHTRLKCCRAALQALRPGGVIILDNSDWLPESSRLLRENGLLQVDMIGFVPACDHVQATSLFFDRQAQLQPLSDTQPSPKRGAWARDWERPARVPGPSVEFDGEVFRGVDDDRSVVFATPDGQRRFRAIAHRGANAEPRLTILDVDAGRVLLSPHLPAGIRPNGDLQPVFERIANMSWTEFRDFIASHDMRRYRL